MSASFVSEQKLIITPRADLFISRDLHSYLVYCLEQYDSRLTTYISPEEAAKQKRIEQLLLILAIIAIKRYLEQLFRLTATSFIFPAILIRKPTKSARTTPFIYFP